MKKICIRWSREIRGGSNFPLSLIVNSNLKDNFVFCEKFKKTYIKKYKYFIYVDMFTENPSKNNSIVNEILLLNKNNLNVFYLESNDSPEVKYPQFVKLFKLWFKKQLYNDLNNYLKSFDGGTLYSDFYFKKYNLKEENHYRSSPMDRKDLSKLDLFWNILIGPYPIKRFKQSLLRRGIAIFGASYFKYFCPNIFEMKETIFPKSLFCHGRFSNHKIYSESIGYQRFLLNNEIQELESVQTGYIRQKDYNRELTQCQIVLSPFGWGEICHRDAEAIHNKALLLKPNMDHIKTIPNIYIKDKMYISLKWDLSNLQQVLNFLKKNPKHIENITSEAYNFLKIETNSFDKFVLSFYNKIVSYEVK